MTLPAKFHVNLPKGGLLGKLVKYTQQFFFRYIRFFTNSPTGQTLRWIFAHDGSNDVVSGKGVLFGG